MAVVTLLTALEALEELSWDVASARPALDRVEVLWTQHLANDAHLPARMDRKSSNAGMGRKSTNAGSVAHTSIHS